MKVRAFPERDKSHKRLKDLADLHALVWYGTGFQQVRTEVVAHVTEEDIARFTDAVTDEAFMNAAMLINVKTAVLRNSIQQLLV